MDHPTAAILTIGSELTEGLRTDTNSAEIALALGGAGFLVEELVSVGDDVPVAQAAIERLTRRYTLVVATGGLGPTHDDITREAASRALERPLVRDRRLETLLEAAVRRHRDLEAASHVLVQADVLEGAEIIDATTGTAPGLVVRTPAGELALLPGPPSEMRPMLATLVTRYSAARAHPRELGVVGLTESDAQVAAVRALGDMEGVRLTVLAKPGDVRVILLDEGAGQGALDEGASRIAEALGPHCYSLEGRTLAEELVLAATARGLTIGVAESCTGGLVAASVTDVSGASECFRGGVVAYADTVKTEMLGVPADTLEAHGAVSEPTAVAMAVGARERLGCDIAVSVTGVAGPGGGTRDKPVGLVWFGVATPEGTHTLRREFPPTSRHAVRARSSSTALDLLRLEVLAR